MIRSLFVENEDGQSMVEYGLIMGLVVLVVIAGLSFFGPAVAKMYNNIALHEAFNK